MPWVSSRYFPLFTFDGFFPQLLISLSSVESVPAVQLFEGTSFFRVGPETSNLIVEVSRGEFEIIFRHRF